MGAQNKRVSHQLIADLSLDKQDGVHERNLNDGDSLDALWAELG